MRASIPSGLGINEQSRLLAFLKAKNQPGYFFKSDLGQMCREFGKDSRTVKKYLQLLKGEGFVGEDSKAYYLRTWKYITAIKGFNQQAFEAEINQIKDKKTFEGLLFSAKVTSIGKAIRRGKQVRKRGFTNQGSPSTGLLSRLCQISTGKVSRLKRQASKQGLLEVTKNFLDFGEGSRYTANILKKDERGYFIRDNRITRRGPDSIQSKVLTYRIKNRKNFKGK